MQTFRSIFPKILAIALAALVIAGCTPAAKVARHLKHGDAYFAAGEYDKARIEYINVLRIDNQNSRAMAQLGIIWSEEGAPIRAFPFLLKARDLAPDNLKARVKLALAYVSIGKLAEARKELLTVLQKSPADDEAIVLLASTVSNQQEWDATSQQFQKHDGPDTAVYHLGSALLLLRKGDKTAAINEVKQALALDPKSVPALLTMARLDWAAKDTAKAGEEFKSAVAAAPPRSVARVDYAQFEWKTGAVDEAKNILAESTRVAPDYLPAWSTLAQIQFEQKNYDDALKSLESLLGRDPANFDARILQGQIWMAKGDVKKAVESMESLDKTYPNTPGVKLQLAHAHLQDGNSAQAIVCLNDAIKLNPDYAEAILLLAEVELHGNNPQPVIASLEALLQKHPGLPQAQLLLADAYHAAGRLDDAANIFRKQIAASPQTAAPYFMLGMLLREQKKDADARAAFEKAHELAPADLLSAYQLVDMDILDKAFDAAHSRIQKQIENDPKSAGAYFLEGRVYAAQRDWDKAEAALKKSLELNANSPTAYELLVSVFIAANKLPDALKELDAVLAKNPNDTGALTLSGIIYEKLNDFTNARDRYEKVLATKPDSPAVLNNLAYLYAVRMNQPDKAYDYAKKARSLEPGDAAIADTLGWILYSRHDYQQSLVLLQESAAKSGTNAEIQFHLGMASYMMGQTEPARKALTMAASGTADFPGKGGIQSRLTLLGSEDGSQPGLSASDLEALVKQQPDDLVAQMRLAEAYEKQGANDKAAAAWEAALKINPQLLPATVKLAQLYAGPLQDKDKAFEMAKKARELAPNDPKVAGILGGIAFQTGNYSWAYSLLQDSAVQQSNDTAVLHDFAWSAYDIGKVGEARDAMRHLLTAAPDSPQAGDARSFLAMTELGEKPIVPAEAEPEAVKLLKAEPNYVPAMMVQAALQAQHGQSLAAAGIYNDILARLPDFAPAQKRLATLYAQDPQQADKAYELAMKARKVLPDDPDLALTLAVISYQRKEYAYAVELFQQSATAAPLNARNLFYLGASCLQIKHNTEGRAALEQALGAGLEEPYATDAKHLLAGLEKK